MSTPERMLYERCHLCNGACVIPSTDDIPTRLRGKPCPCIGSKSPGYAPIGLSAAGIWPR